VITVVQATFCMIRSVTSKQTIFKCRLKFSGDSLPCCVSKVCVSPEVPNLMTFGLDNAHRSEGFSQLMCRITGLAFSANYLRLR
jgi:hypothetical protein